MHYCFKCYCTPFFFFFFKEDRTQYWYGSDTADGSIDLLMWVTQALSQSITSDKLFLQSLNITSPVHHWSQRFLSLHNSLCHDTSIWAAILTGVWALRDTELKLVVPKLSASKVCSLECEIVYWSC